MERIRLFAAVLSAVTLQCNAQIPKVEVEQAKAALQRHFAGATLDESETAFGDLNGDGIGDFATLVADDENDDYGNENVRIAVFFKRRDNTYSFYETSSKIGHNPRATLGLTIQKNALYLNRDGSNGCCSHSVEKWQFMFRQGKLMLVGLEAGSAHPEGSAEPSYTVSANLLTARVEKSKGARRRTNTKAEGLKPVPLRDFDYEQFNTKWSKALWQ
jgi:hypothetical protein